MDDIVEGLEMQSDEYPAFLDRETGEVVSVSSETLREAEDAEGDKPDSLPDWQLDELALAEQILSTDRYLELPSNFDIHEWDIMREFSESLDAGAVRDELLRAIHGRGAFRMFKDVIHRHRSQDDWYDFRLERIREIAAEWCEGNGIAYESNKRPILVDPEASPPKDKG